MTLHNLSTKTFEFAKAPTKTRTQSNRSLFCKWKTQRFILQEELYTSKRETMLYKINRANCQSLRPNCLCMFQWLNPKLESSLLYQKANFSFIVTGIAGVIQTLYYMYLSTSNTTQRLSFLSENSSLTVLNRISRRLSTWTSAKLTVCTRETFSLVRIVDWAKATLTSMLPTTMMSFLHSSSEHIQCFYSLWDILRDWYSKVTNVDVWTKYQNRLKAHQI